MGEVVLKVGDLVERIDEEGGSLHEFPLGAKAIVTFVGGRLIRFDNNAMLFPQRVRLVQSTVIEGDDDEDCV